MPPRPWFPDDDEHRLPPPPTPEWIRRLHLNRRNFIKVGLGGLAAGLATVAWQSRPAPAPEPPPSLAAAPPEPATAPAGASAEPAAAPAEPAAATVPAAPPAVQRPPVLVVVQLSGGNDGLRTVVPYTDDGYYKSRPTLAVDRETVIPIDDTIGWHPNLARLKPIWDAGHLALLQGVGYPNPNRSHFRSMDIWHTAEPATLENYGWLGKYMDLALRDASTPFKVVNVGTNLPKALWARETPAASIRDVAAFQLRTNLRFNNDRADLLKAFDRLNARPPADPFFELVNKNWSATTEGARILQAAADRYRSTVSYPTTPFANNLRLIAGLLQADLGTRVFYTELGGFDDHAGEKVVHDRLLSQLGDGLAAFHQDLTGMGLLDQVMVLTFSEFGRRVKENASAGTDHGAAQPLLVLGGRVNGGMYGSHPSLSTLDDGDLKYGIDFRAVYNTVLSDWLNAPGQDILGQPYERLGFVKGAG